MKDFHHQNEALLIACPGTFDEAHAGLEIEKTFLVASMEKTTLM